MALSLTLSAQEGRLQPAAVPAAFSFEIVAGQRFGPVHENTSRVSLPRLFPPGSLRDADVYLGEGFCADGTHVFGGTSDAIEIAWQDATKTKVAFVRTKTPGSRWKTSLGVRVGTTLRELESIAGGVVVFSGFGWDYGGGMSWTEGGREIGLNLVVDPTSSTRPPGEPSNIDGDRPIRSDNPVARALTIRVGMIIQRWGIRVHERDCGPSVR